MKKIVAAVKKIFSRKKVINLFATNNDTTLAELGGNYCSDTC